MDLERKIGFDRIRLSVRERCATDYARKRVDGEVMATDAEEILSRLRPVDEMRLICLFEDSFPTAGYVDARPFLKPLEAPSTWIDLPSLVRLRTAMDTLRLVLGFFDKCKDDLYPSLRALAEGIVYYPEVTRRISLILGRDNEVRDSASPALQSIRRSLREKDGVIAKRIDSILRSARAEGIIDDEAAASVRDGRMLIPVPVANKKKIPGLVYDESSSGKTAFVEPLEVIELENQIRELQFEEQREIQRILFEFSEFLRPYLPELIAASDFLGELDFIHAKAVTGVEMIAGMPILSTTGELILRKARHPLLEASLRREHKEIVPLSLTLNRNKRILLISGPNAGGKSVCLKTVGLLQYMFQWGLLIPTSEISEMLVFDRIFIDIGDNQSIENDLSTYSSHLSNLKDMLEGVTEHSLVLIDEFGSGTEPAAGGAIAEAVLAELDRMKVYGVITTHYTNLKMYASGNTGVANGAMLFDAANIRPMFKLEQGLPGNSFAFELARQIGLPEDVVRSAEERAGKDFVNIERNLRKIARNRKALDEKLAHIKATDRTLENLTDRYEKELSEIKALKKEILDGARREASQILNEANKRVEQTIRDIREAQAEKEKTREIRRDLKEFREKVENVDTTESDRKIEEKIARIVARKEREAERRRRRGEEKPSDKPKKAAPEVDNRPLQVGDKVLLKDSGFVGEVVRISAKTISVSVGSVISRVVPAKVERVSENRYREETRASRPARQSFDNTSLSRRRLEFSPSIDIRGERLADAMEIVVRFIDDALMLGMGQVKILHGKGTGALREEIRKYLRTVPGVASVRDEALEMGGAGITVVDFQL